MGAAVAFQLDAGFVAIRKDAGLFPGEKLTRRTSLDYRGNSTSFRIQRASLSEGDRVLLVDDWAETGSQMLTAKALIDETGADLVGVSVIVDQLSAETRARIGRFTAVVLRDALGPSSSSH